MRLIDADALLEIVEDHVTAVSCCPTVDWSMGKTQMKKQVIEDICNAPTVGGWISVNDRKPEASGIYLTWCTYHDIKRGFYRLSEYCAENGGWYDWISRDYGESYVRYWMPLPEPPKEVKQND